MITAHRYHDFSCGHRVFGHESKCAHLHGHNYRIHFHVAPRYDELDPVGRVLDFSVIASVLCTWLEVNWDHRFLVWYKDPWAPLLKALDPTVVEVPFNPTAELMALHLMTDVAPTALAPHNCVLTEVTVEETRKCSATVS